MTKHVVVDGSNIATEGRPMPSLAQLHEAVLAFIAEHPDSLITVVVDSTFGHRIDASERPAFDEAVANNEVVAPPAGAVGRGDAFVLGIANKVNATILSNDSFQEFHGQYPWLFDEGRLIGGKPVPHVGWVFVSRTPVRGPVSRKATSEAKRRRAGGAPGHGADSSTVRIGSPEASRPMPVPTAPPPAPVKAAKAAAKQAATAKSGGRAAKQSGKASAKPEKAVPASTRPVVAPKGDQAAVVGKRDTGNDPMSFLSFVAQHPVGTNVQAVVDHYSSHGAYVKVGDVFCYVPLRLMASPPPRSAREFMRLGDTLTFVVEKFVGASRSIDLAVPGMSSVEPVVNPQDHPPKKASKKAAAQKKAAAKKAAPAKPTATKPAAAAPVAPKKAATKKAVPAKAAATKPATKKAAAATKKVAPTKATSAKKAAPAKAAATKPVAKKAPAAKAPAKKAVVKTPAAKTPAAKTPASKKPAAKKAASKKPGA